MTTKTPWDNIYGVPLQPRLPATVPPVQPGYANASDALRSNAAAQGASGEGLFDRGQTPTHIFWPPRPPFEVSEGPTVAVTSWNGRVGDVTFELADLEAVGGALLDSPTFTGTVTIAGTLAVQGSLSSPGATVQSLLVSSTALVQSLTVPGGATINQPVLQGQAISQGGLLVEGALQATGLATLQQPVLIGVTDGSDAMAGQVGEWRSVVLAGGVPVPNNGVAAVRGLTLTPGDWDVVTNAVFAWTGQPGLMAAVSLGLTPNQSALPDGVRLYAQFQAGTLIQAGPVRISIPSQQVVYANCETTFPAGGACTASAQITARRVR